MVRSYCLLSWFLLTGVSVLVAAKEEQHRLRMGLKVLSEAKVQMRMVMVTDHGTGLTAALLHFAPDR